MGLLKDLRLFSKPLLIGGSSIFGVSFLFITVCLRVEHHQYLQAYQKTQQEELKAIQQKTEDIIGKLKELLQLTGSRISISHNNAKQIQEILGSSPRFYEPHELPKIQNFSYYKFSSPQLLVSRLGIVPLESKHFPIVQPSGKDPIINSTEEAITGHMLVFDKQSKIQGMLKIHILPSDFMSCPRIIGPGIAS